MLGDALYAVVGFGVAVILFEGGMGQDIRQLRREAVAIRRLVILGAVITAIGGAVAANQLLGWGWQLSLLFGTLVIVTGPTVIAPLLRRIEVTQKVETVIALSKTRVIGDGLENIFALSTAILTFEVSNALMPESGIAAAIAAGMVAGNSSMQVLEQLQEFKEQLATLLISVLFILLAADVRVDEIVLLGLPGVYVVLALMLVVRPITVFLCTIGTQLTVREKRFISWLAPRGIVAASIASLFAHGLARAGIEGGSQNRALVFLVIAMTVTVQGSSGKLVAWLLGVKRPGRSGFILVGANALSRTVGHRLRDHDQDVTLIDVNDDLCHAAEEEGLRVLYGNALHERTLLRARTDRRKVFAGITTSEKINYMVSSLVYHAHYGPQLMVALTDTELGVTAPMMERIGASVLSGASRDLDRWAVLLRQGDAAIERWAWRATAGKEPPAIAGMPGALLLLLLHQRKNTIALVDDRIALDKGDIIDFAIDGSQREAAKEWLHDSGWTCKEPPADDGGELSRAA